MHLPAIISDLAMILLVAGVTTLLFKRINQPLVLGYIIAGFLTGPYFQYFPTVADSVNVSTWSEIGVIFLLFALGLEFSFYKLKSVGSTAFIGTACEILGMLLFGFIAGKLLGWNDMNAVFLGGMLSMSSTTIIIKAFDDLKMRAEKFTEVVFGMLIVEDIAGIVMMVLLSTIAVASANISISELLLSVGRLVFFLVLWFVCGIYLIPTFFKKQERIMSEETLIICTIGLCLGMAVLATKMGFSSALGAFIMGSLIAEAPNLHKIEKLVQPIKDLFGAVFFVSVGMLVDPAMLVQYWVPILVIIATTIIGKLIFSTTGVLLGGKNLHDSVHAGFSLAQIGEFSFIIAGLGTSLGVTESYLYPIVVAVSVLTTFTTPYFINATAGGYHLLQQILPQRVLDYVDRTESEDKAINHDSDWQQLSAKYISNYLVSVTLLAAIAIGVDLYGVDALAYVIKAPFHLYGATLLALLLMAPLMKALLIPSDYNDFYTVLWFKNTINRVPLLMLKLINIATCAGGIFYVLRLIGEVPTIYSAPITFGCFYFIYCSNFLTSRYLKIKSRFLINLN
ncbi:MAG: cation:proton antiporter, partial [Acidaminococcaceae bacterium]|nr:cation:proton antiporter [Acidaminococcaceae bacterium]